MALPKDVATKKPGKKAAAVKDVAVRAVRAGRTREEIMTDVCAILAAGGSLNFAVSKVADAKTQTILDWTNKYPELSGQYTQARMRGYQFLADDIIAISDEIDVVTNSKDGGVTLQLDATAIARNRLRVDTRKWMLSKMLPKIYGDKLTTEVTGAGGGPVQIASMNLRGVSDDELKQMQEILNRTGE